MRIRTICVPKCKDTDLKLDRLVDVLTSDANMNSDDIDNEPTEKVGLLRCKHCGLSRFETRKQKQDREKIEKG